MSESSIPRGQESARLERVDQALRRHLNTPFRPPISPTQAQAFDEITAFVRATPELAWELDAGCGTGESTGKLSSRDPNRRFLGVDKSKHRLLRAPASSAHLGFVRADLDRALPQLADAGLKAARVHLLYPNPWPKPSHFGRRWHGHPTFFDLLRVSEKIELRTNWEIYAIEFAYALGRTLGREVHVEPLNVIDPLSAFERKYAASGHPLFQVRS